MTVIIIVLIIILFITLASFYFYHVAIARTDKSFLNGNPDLEVKVTAQKPFHSIEEWWRKQAYSEWSLVSNDGIKLHAYYLAADQPSNKTAILAHGYFGKSEQMRELAKMYRDSLGFNVLMPDARGHGRSEGNYIGFGWSERLDYVKWIDRIIEQTGSQAQIVLHGISMGAATVTMTSGEDLPPNVKVIVEDCGYTSVKDQLSYQLKRMYHLPSFPLIQSTSLLTKLRAGYFFGEASALEQVKKSKTPTLFIHGDTDLFVPTQMVYELYENSPTHKKLFIVPGAGHGMARQTNPEAYDQEVARFIGKYVK
ncbi:alpha/beta hydrolase [Paenibacillus sp. N5-1-1-5]|uniref:Alpha/beta hydrolase n=1 Tax=Paenibacillus radicis (ex Xue et al. 2023) TaxID=2972489 RepID=A0ABT1YPT1_9BACL|nr:alpha/beta hydrolase [Paenibacillus radicis (ex Xue et al. 2023)]MCR8635199.1 alpha/beta hydrolase [Paenibacillus radicis (ex Xue et al. 2023)]